MHEGACTGSVIHSSRTVGGGAGSRVTARAAEIAAHVPAGHRRAMHTIPLCAAAAGRDGTADDCGV